jgi:hypothetical protein
LDSASRSSSTTISPPFHASFNIESLGSFRGVGFFRLFSGACARDRVRSGYGATGHIELFDADRERIVEADSLSYRLGRVRGEGNARVLACRDLGGFA